MLWSDAEVGMSLANKRNMRNAQSVVDELDDEIVALRAKLAAALDDLADERALRLATELKLSKLNRLLDTPIN